MKKLIASFMLRQPWLLQQQQMRLPLLLPLKLPLQQLLQHLLLYQTRAIRLGC